MNTRFLVERVLQMVIVMWIVATIVFFVFRILPGDQAVVLLGQGSTEASRAALRAELGLDQPLIVQYVDWLASIMRGDFGVAAGYGNSPVTSLLGGATIRSFELASTAFLIALVFAIPLGVLAAVRESSWVDHLTRAVAVVGFSMPVFWLGILFLLFFSAQLGWFPSGGYVAFAEDPAGHLQRLFLPALTVGVVQTGVLVRFVRSSMVEVLQEDYIRTARAKGIRERKVNFKHALRNSSLSFLTVAGIQFGLLLGGMVVVEKVFAWPGLGLLTVQALGNRSYEVVQGAVLLSAAVFVIVNTGVDLLYAVLDPRIRNE